MEGGGCLQGCRHFRCGVTLRPGIQTLLQDAQAGRFEMVLAEALDRISRDQADVAILYKHFKFAGVTLVTLAGGEIPEPHVGLKGTMNALFLKDLAAKTHRGLRGRLTSRIRRRQSAAQRGRANAPLAREITGVWCRSACRSDD